MRVIFTNVVIFIELQLKFYLFSWNNYLFLGIIIIYQLDSTNVS